MSSGTSKIAAGNYPDAPGAVQMCSALRKALKLPTDLLLLGFTAIGRYFFSIQDATLPRLGQHMWSEGKAHQFLHNLDLLKNNFVGFFYISSPE